MTTQLRFGLFVLVALLQLSFPGKLVFDSRVPRAGGRDEGV
jgi:hypothetical protein